MSEQEHQKPQSYMATNRVEALTDGIFAIAMTILALNIAVPSVPTESAVMEIPRFLKGLWHVLLNYAISFILLGVFWIIHHRQFHRIKHIDEKLLWLNMLNLMFIVLIPFSTSLMSGYDNVQIADVVFEINLLIAGLFCFLQWSYATKNRHLVDPELDQSIIDAGKKKNLVIPLVSIAGMALSFISPEWCTVVYLITPFIMGIFFKG